MGSEAMENEFRLGHGRTLYNRSARSKTMTIEGKNICRRLGAMLVIAVLISGTLLAQTDAAKGATGAKPEGQTAPAGLSDSQVATQRRTSQFAARRVRVAAGGNCASPLRPGYAMRAGN